MACPFFIHRLTSWFGLEGTFKDHLIQSPCHGQGNLPLTQVAQSPIQHGFEQFQWWGTHIFSEQPIPVSHHPHCKKFLPYVRFKSTFFQFKAIASCPVTTDLGKKALSVFLTSPLCILEGCNKVFLEPFLLQAVQPQFYQPFFIGEVFQPSHTGRPDFSGPPLDPL